MREMPSSLESKRCKINVYCVTTKGSTVACKREKTTLSQAYINASLSDFICSSKHPRKSTLGCLKENSAYLRQGLCGKDMNN